MRTFFFAMSQGGLAVGDLLFGHENPSGKLPVTFPKSLDQVPAFTDYSMKNRTYRYIAAEPMYPFGFGLSYTTFEYSNLKLTRTAVAPGRSLSATVTVTNTGAVAGQDVVQLYLTDQKASVDVPKYALKDYRRITLQPGKSKRVRFQISPEMMRLVDAEGNWQLEPGRFTAHVGGASPDNRAQTLGAPKLTHGEFELLAE